MAQRRVTAAPACGTVVAIGRSHMRTTHPKPGQQLDIAADLAAEQETLAAFCAQVVALCPRTPPFRCGACSHDRLCACKMRIIDLLTEMLAYLFRHFPQEEALFDTCLPPRLAESHRLSHARITRLLGESIRQCWDSTHCLSHTEELLPALERHLKDHDAVLLEALRHAQAAAETRNPRAAPCP